MESIGNNNKLKISVEAGIMIALTVLLNSIKLYNLPKGGSITLGGYVPLMIFSLRWGLKKGLIVGMTYGFLDSLIDPYVIAPMQFLLDYPLAYAMFGFTGIASKNIGFKSLNDKFIVMGSAVLANLLRLLMAVLSGIIFFKEYLPDNFPYILSSIIYNGSYVIPNMIISMVIIAIILPRLRKTK